MTYYGDFPTNHTGVCMVFDTFAAATGAPTATTNFANTDIQIYKDGGTTQRSSASGIVVSTSFDSNTGLQMVTIDLSDNTDAGFYAAGHEYDVAVADITADGQTLRFWLGAFSIERAGGVLALVKARTPNAAAGASGGLLISGSNSGTTTFGALTVTGTLTLTGNVHLSDGISVDAPSTANRAGISISGNGTGAGVSITGGGGATGNAVTITASSTNGVGISISGSGASSGVSITSGGGATGNAIDLIASSTDGIGLNIAGSGIQTATQLMGGATGPGINIAGGATSGDSIQLSTTNGHGLITFIGGSSKHGMSITGGNAGTSDGIKATAGTGGVPIRGNITGNITGNLSGSVGSVTGAVGSVSGAVGSVSGNIGGNLLGTLTSSERNSIADAILARSLAAESYAADGAVPTLSQVLYLIQQTIGEFAITATTLTVKKMDGSTTAATYTLDSATTPTSRTRAT